MIASSLAIPKKIASTAPVFATYSKHRLQPSVYGGFILKMGVPLLNIIIFIRKINEETKTVDLNERLFLSHVAFCPCHKNACPVLRGTQKSQDCISFYTLQKFYFLN